MQGSVIALDVRDVDRRASDEDFMPSILQFPSHIFKEGVVVGDRGYDEEDFQSEN
jgi:hypothetical protein